MGSQLTLLTIFVENVESLEKYAPVCVGLVFVKCQIQNGFSVFRQSPHEPLNRVETFRESLVGSRVPFELPWREIHQAYQEFFAAHNLLLRDYAPKI